jgi:hypothetical protein
MCNEFIRNTYTFKFHGGLLKSIGILRPEHPDDTMRCDSEQSTLGRAGMGWPSSMNECAFICIPIAMFCSWPIHDVI